MAVVNGWESVYTGEGVRQGGANFRQVAGWLQRLGATFAVGFDGGGSSAMYGSFQDSWARLDLPQGGYARTVHIALAVTHPESVTQSGG